MKQVLLRRNFLEHTETPDLVKTMYIEEQRKKMIIGRIHGHLQDIIVMDGKRTALIISHNWNWLLLVDVFTLLPICKPIRLCRRRFESGRLNVVEIHGRQYVLHLIDKKRSSGYKCSVLLTSLENGAQRVLSVYSDSVSLLTFKDHEIPYAAIYTRDGILEKWNLASGVLETSLEVGKGLSMKKIEVSDHTTILLESIISPEGVTRERFWDNRPAKDTMSYLIIDAHHFNFADVQIPVPYYCSAYLLAQLGDEGILITLQNKGLRADLWSLATGNLLKSILLDNDPQNMLSLPQIAYSAPGSPILIMQGCTIQSRSLAVNLNDENPEPRYFHRTDLRIKKQHLEEWIDPSVLDRYQDKIYLTDGAIPCHVGDELLVFPFRFLEQGAYSLKTMQPVEGFYLPETSMLQTYDCFEKDGEGYFLSTEINDDLVLWKRPSL